MKRLLLSCTLLALVLAGCSSDSTTNPEEDIYVNLETFVPDASFDDSFKGKYIGIFGHHTNLDMHGKIYINAGHKDQYKAMVQLVDGNAIDFVAETSSSSDLSAITFTSKEVSFVADFSDYENPLVSEVIIKGESNPGFVVLKKVTSTRSPFVRLGLYQDSTDPFGFRGLWDIITDGVFIPIEVPPYGGTFYQNISQIVLSHEGDVAPITIEDFNTFSTFLLQSCLEPVVGPSIPNQPFICRFPFSLASGFVILASDQTALVNGSTLTYHLAYHDPILPFNPGYFGQFCEETTSGTWSWNGRSGSIIVPQ